MSHTEHQYDVYLAHATEDEPVVRATKIKAVVAQLIDHSRQHFRDALDLRDPEPTEANNFQLDDKEYHYRAADTHQVLV